MSSSTPPPTASPARWRRQGRHEAQSRGRRLLRPRSRLTVFFLVSAVLVTVLGAPVLAATLVIHPPARPAHSSASTTPAQQAALLVTPPVASGSPFLRQSLAVDPRFQPYYASTAGKLRLGAAVTPAIPVTGGWLQFFSSGALFRTGQSPIISPHWLAQASDSGIASSAADLLTSALAEAIQQSTRTATDSVTMLPLLSLLLQAGSEVDVGGMSDVTYANLRAAIAGSALVPAPEWYAPNRPVGLVSAFVPEAVRQGTVLGHLVPLSFWNTMTQADTDGDGWTVDFGLPETEALPITATVGGAAHHLLVQVFQQTALVVDTSVVPQLPHILSIGLDYLRTFGPPPVLMAPATSAWVLSATVARQAPSLASSPRAHLGPGYLLRLAAASRWVDGALWYQVVWAGARGSATGWVLAQALTFAGSLPGPAQAGFDVLDPGLAAYLAGLGDLVGVVVSDLSHNVYYASNPAGQFITGSSVKVPIMLALLAQTEAQGREPDGSELYLLTTMIENSDNGSAQALYEEIGDAPGLAAAMQRFGVAGLSPTPGAWGWSHITPAAMAQLLTLLQTGRILTAQDRALALELMEQVEPDQQFGVGDTAPTGATVAMKNGWVTGPDTLWVVNTSGIVTTARETYIITVYTRDDASFQQGVALVEYICSAVGADLGAS